MQTEEQRLFSDVVRLVNRTDHQLEFKHDAVTYMIEAGKHKFLPRHIAMFGVKQNNTKIDSETGLVMESLFGIDEKGGFYPCTPIKNVNLKEVKERPKLDSDQEDLTIEVDGKEAKFKSQRVRGNKESKNMSGAVV